MQNTVNEFLITGRVVIITGGAGLMGKDHARAVLSGKGIPVLIDIKDEYLNQAKEVLKNDFPDGEIFCVTADITSRESIETAKSVILEKYGRIDVLINNAANNPKVEGNSANMKCDSFSDFSISIWNDDIAVGLTGALICTQVFGEHMANIGSGVILNISSDLGIIAPDQRIYEKEGLAAESQIKKPVTYSVIKHGLIGLTKYTATYWANRGVRCNSICPGGIENGQDSEFLGKVTNLIPMGRMAKPGEYKATVLYLISDASQYMTGSTVIIDGGRTCW